jgi:hypothetical protein
LAGEFQQADCRPGGNRHCGNRAGLPPLVRLNPIPACRRRGSEITLRLVRETDSQHTTTTI